VRGEKIYFRKLSEEKSVPTQMVGMDELRNVAGHASFGNCTIRVKVEELLLKSSREEYHTFGFNKYERKE
jgi:hypothetical protein